MNDQVKTNLLASGEFVDQVASLVGVLADQLPSNGTLPENIESFVKEKVEESMSDQDVDIGTIVDEKIEEYDMSDKVSDALNGLDVVDEDQATEIANQALYDHDWYEVISDHGLVTRDDLDIDDRVEEIVNAKLFVFMQEIIQKCFKSDFDEWKDDVGRGAVMNHLAGEKASAEEAPPSIPVEV